MQAAPVDDREVTRQRARSFAGEDLARDVDVFAAGLLRRAGRLREVASPRTLASLISIGRLTPATTSTRPGSITEMARLEGVPPNMSVSRITPAPSLTRSTARHDVAAPLLHVVFRSDRDRLQGLLMPNHMLQGGAEFRRQLPMGDKHETDHKKADTWGKGRHHPQTRADRKPILHCGASARSAASHEDQSPGATRPGRAGAAGARRAACPSSWSLLGQAVELRLARPGRRAAGSPRSARAAPPRCRARAAPSCRRSPPGRWRRRRPWHAERCTRSSATSRAPCPIRLAASVDLPAPDGPRISTALRAGEHSRAVDRFAHQAVSSAPAGRP